MWGERSYKESLTGISITGMGTSITHTHSHTHAHGISVHGTSTHTPSAHHTQSAEKSARTDEGLLGALGALGAMPIVMERMEMGRGRMGPMGGAIGGALGGVGGDFDMHPPALSRVTSFAAFESPVLYDLPKSERQMARLKQEKRKAIAKTAEFQELRFSFASESALSVLSKQARVKASLEGGKY
ncbi:hypothetical protein B484DRAFT_201129 [Ochromonadaceae sp. CCMP2298]|nr:hypothetical protein B484DRAFT_201129 [Ochromonadaceae sp. CCMP2298]